MNRHGNAPDWIVSLFNDLDAQDAILEPQKSGNSFNRVRV